MTGNKSVSAGKAFAIGVYDFFGLGMAIALSIDFASKSGSDFPHGPASVNAPVPNRTSCAIATLLRRLDIVYLRLP